jgi:hypothetical protein
VAKSLHIEPYTKYAAIGRRTESIDMTPILHQNQSSMEQTIWQPWVALNFPNRYHYPMSPFVTKTTDNIPDNNSKLIWSPSSWLAHTRLTMLKFDMYLSHETPTHRSQYRLLTQDHHIKKRKGTHEIKFNRFQSGPLTQDAPLRKLKRYTFNSGSLPTVSATLYRKTRRTYPKTNFTNIQNYRLTHKYWIKRFFRTPVTSFDTWLSFILL